MDSCHNYKKHNNKPIKNEYLIISPRIDQTVASTRRLLRTFQTSIFFTNILRGFKKRFHEFKKRYIFARNSNPSNNQTNAIFVSTFENTATLNRTVLRSLKNKKALNFF